MITSTFLAITYNVKIFNQKLNNSSNNFLRSYFLFLNKDQNNYFKSTHHLHKICEKSKKIQMNSYILILLKIYQNNIQMQRQNNHLQIKVQTCCNCHLHSWCTRHDQSKYNAFYQKFQTMIKAHLPKAVISRNQPPAHYQRVYDSPQGPDRYIDQNNYEVSYPRSGAFQISVNGVEIFSKLKSSLWPSIERVVKLIMNIDKDIKQNEDIQKYSLQYRLQNDHDFSFVQTYRAELKRKQMVKVFTHDKPISSGGNRSFKSRRLFSNSKTKKKSTQPEQSSPIINSRKFQGSHLIKLNQNIHQISDFNDEQQDKQIYKWKLKESKKQEQNLIKKTPLLINKSKVMQKLKNKSGILKDNKAKEDQINLHRLIDEKLEEGKNSSKLNNTKKVEEKRESKNEDDSGGKLKGWSDKEQKSKSDFVINETSNSLKDKRQQIETKKKPSINQKLQENQEEDYQFILEQSQGQQNVAKNRKPSKDQQKIYLKPKDQDQKSYAESNDKKSLHIEQTFSQKSIDIKNFYQIYEKIANWEAVYTESQEDYEVYEFTLLLMSKNFQSEPSDKNEIQSFQQFEEQNLDVFRVKQAEVKQIKYKQLVYHKYAEINWNTRYKNGFKLAREGEDDLQSFCEEIMEDNQIDEVKIQQAKKIKNNILKNQQRKQKQQKLAAELKKFNQADNIKIQTAYPSSQNWVTLYQNNHFLIKKESKTKVFQPKQEKPILKSPVRKLQSYQQQKWLCEYSNNQFRLQKKIDKAKITQNQSEEKLIKKEIKVEAKKQIKPTKQLTINLEDYTEEKWAAEYSNIGFELKKTDKVEEKLVVQHSKKEFLLQKKQTKDKTAMKVSVEIRNNQVKAESKKEQTSKNSQKAEIKKEAQIKQTYDSTCNWLARYSQDRFQLFKKEEKRKTDAPTIGQKQQIKTENQKEHTEIKEVKKANSEQISPKKIQIKQQPKKQSIQIPKEKGNQIKNEKISEALKMKNENEKKQIEKNKQPGAPITPESILWIAQYKGVEFTLKKDENISQVTKTGDKKNSIIAKSQNQPKQQEKVNKIIKNEERDPNIIWWAGKYKNNQYMLQQIISV